MIVSQRIRALFKVLAIALAVGMPLMASVSSADARGGRGFSSGSRGSRTFAPPPVTRTAPNAAQPMQRTITPQTTAPVNAANKGGLFNRPGLLGGLAAGFLGAGLLGMLFGNGLFGGLGGLASILGFVVQLVLIFFLARLAMSWWARRNAPAYANTAPPQANADQQQTYARTGFGLGGGSSAPLEITPADYEAFERRLSEIQEAWSNEDTNRLHRLATPEMVSYFSQDLAENASRGVVNKVSDVKLLQGDLAEAWREGPSDYATVAMRFSLVDKAIERASGRVVEGGDTPEEVTEIWTFVRRPGTEWELSAIQQTS
ncbi:TIM44-like domain-containing protein [[Pseudomonas] carboxydohydrogena]|uniref:TIM44-like domain-containing protein n=1 Tax=Afipia carboxydohydrogena TaxID=290 RepID=A0ABY8BW50_AFICR|nr:TIM44-like domain-containing protein [[Pseudomonas] carboxydohydrogena]WEF52647.1 TIM44-like domain-containing protein [[Pseudomonas] carboxydohydrogena]